MDYWMSLWCDVQDCDEYLSGGPYTPPHNRRDAVIEAKEAGWHFSQKRGWACPTCGPQT